MTDRESLFHDLDNGIFVTLRAIADTYEEEGDLKMAEAYRWMADNKRLPLYSTEGIASGWEWQLVSFTGRWFRKAHPDWPLHWMPVSVSLQVGARHRSSSMAEAYQYAAGHFICKRKSRGSRTTI